ncbi:MAG: acetate/propionate family kinase [Armatimonadota bacterium]|nr:acetate/propionate family kinase [Armatimonadota bacterium]
MQKMNVLVVNCGGATLKYKLYQMPGERVLAQGHVDRLGSDRAILKHLLPETETEVRVEMAVPDHHTAIRWMLDQLTSSEHGALETLEQIKVVGHKIAHDGMKLGDAAVLNSYEIAVIREMVALAPVHNPPSLTGIEIFQELLPGTPQTASFETGFHRTVAPAAYIYGLPYEWLEKYGVRRYGFHSCSHRYVSTRVGKLMRRPGRLKIILCHLGSGTSVCAVHDGQSVDIASGLTPQSGTMMSTRPGDYDAGAVNYIIRRAGLSAEEFDRLEIKESGLKGISGIDSGDMRDVEEAINAGHERARLAFDVFCHKIRHYIGAYYVQMNGCDAITFTGGIGENSVAVRQAVCHDLDCIGARLDDAKNASGPEERPIHARDSRVHIWIVPTDEEIVVARDSARLLGASA